MRSKPLHLAVIPVPKSRKHAGPRRTGTPNVTSSPLWSRPFLSDMRGPKTKARSAEEAERIFRKHVLPVWGEKQVQDIARRDVIELLDRLVDAGKPVLANRTLAHVRKFFNWCIERSILDASPCVRITAPAYYAPRDDAPLGHVVKHRDEVIEFGGVVAVAIALAGQLEAEQVEKQRPKAKLLRWTLLAATLAYMAATRDSRIKSARFLTTQVDFSHAGLSVYFWMTSEIGDQIENRFLANMESPKIFHGLPLLYLLRVSWRSIRCIPFYCISEPLPVVPPSTTRR